MLVSICWTFEKNIHYCYCYRSVSIFGDRFANVVTMNVVFLEHSVTTRPLELQCLSKLAVDSGEVSVDFVVCLPYDYAVLVAS